MRRLWLFLSMLACLSQPALSQEAGTGYVSHVIYDYQFVLPTGWTGTTYPDGVVYISPVHSNGERCQVTVFPKRTTSGNLLNDAIGVFRSLFQADPLAGYPAPPTTLTYGMSPHGWEYLLLKKSTGGQVGDYGSLIGTIVLVATNGKELAIIVGRSKDPLVSLCFGELVRDEWSRFFYSLRFKNWNAANKDPKLKQKLLGTWTSASASASDRLSFTPNNRYAGVAAALHRQRISGTEVLQTTDAFFGDGSYQLQGNAITMIADSDPLHPTQGYFRLEQESKDGGRSWAEKLCILRHEIGEVCYQRDR